jgi:hypothetical protein
MEQAFDLLRMVSHVIESVEERATKILRSFKEPIVCDMLARVMPDSFGRIQFRPRAEAERLSRSDGSLGTSHGFLFFVIRSIVLNKVDSVVTAVEGGHDHLLQESQIGLPLKIVFLWMANCYFAHDSL